MPGKSARGEAPAGRWSDGYAAAMLRHALLVLAVCGGLVRAQDEVLTVERRADLKAQAETIHTLRSVRLDFVAKATTPKDLCRTLSTLTGDKVNFAYVPKPDTPVPAFDLELRATNLFSVLAAVEMQTGLRFVLRSGVVFLVDKADVHPLTYLQVYDLRAMVMPLRSFPGPKLGLPVPGGEQEPLFPPAEDSGTTVSGFTAEGVETLLKENVTPDQWGSGQASLTNSQGLFIVRQTPAGHRQIRLLLDRLGLLPLPRVVLPGKAARPLPKPPAKAPPHSR
jgi:hypothetical protein